MARRRAQCRGSRFPLPAGFSGILGLAAALSLLGLPALPAAAAAQVPGDTARGGAPADAPGGVGPLRVSGSVAVSLDAYGVNGIASRREPGVAQIASSLGFDLWGLRSGLNLLLSTDQSGLRQSVNRVEYSGEWSWGRVEAGDVTPRFSEYGLGGITLRGGYVEVERGPLVLGFAGGRAARAVERGFGFNAREPSFSRTLWAARLGVQRSGSHFIVSGVYARDDTASLSDPAGVVPKENVSITPDLRLRLAGGRVQVEGEVTLSALTRDTRTPEAELSDDAAPAFLTAFLTPRLGSRADYAGRGAVELNFSSFGVRGSYERVNPGFESLGMARIRADREVLSLRPRASFLNRRVHLTGTFSVTRNNLFDHLVRTVRRQQLGLTAQLRVGRAVTLSGSAQQTDNRSEAADDTAVPAGDDLRQVARVFTLTPTVTFRRGGITHTGSLSLSRQTVDDRSDEAVPVAIRAAFGSTGTTGTLTWAAALPSGLSFNATGSRTTSEAASLESRIHSITLGAGHALLERRLTLNLTGSWATSDTELTLDPASAGIPARSRQLASTLAAGWRLPNQDVLRLTLRAQDNASLDGPGRSFSEVFATLRFEHAF